MIFFFLNSETNIFFSFLKRATSPVNHPHFGEDSNKSFSDADETLDNFFLSDMPPLVNASGSSTPVNLPTFSLKNEMHTDYLECNNADEQGFL